MMKVEIYPQLMLLKQWMKMYVEKLKDSTCDENIAWFEDCTVCFIVC